MSVHVHRLAGLIEHLNKKNMSFYSCLAIKILDRHIHVLECLPITASIKTSSEENVSWKDTAERLIEEVRVISFNNGAEALENLATEAACQIC